MKKFYFSLAAIAAIFAGCSKEVDNLKPEPVIPNEKAVSLKADVCDPETKVSSDNAGVFKWQSSDEITVVTNGDEIRQFTIGDISGAGTSADFDGTIPEGADMKFALYPASEDHICDVNALLFNLDDNVTWKADATNMPMLATVSSNSASFVSVGGVLKLVLFNIPADADYLKFSATNKQISGGFEIANATVEAPVIATAAKEGNNNVQVIDFSENYSASKVFYIPLPTGTIDGFTVALYETLEAEPLYTVTSNKSLSVVANKLIIAPAMNCSKVILWSENFTNFSAGAQGGDLIYSIDNGGGTTSIKSESLAGGSSPELLVAKGNGYFEATGVPTSGEGTISLSFRENYDRISVSTTTDGVSITGGSFDSEKKLYTATVTNTKNASTIVLKFTNTDASNNVRLDDISLVIPGSGFTSPVITADDEELTIAVGGFTASTDVNLANAVDGLGISCLVSYPDENKWIESAVIADGELTITAKAANTTTVDYAATITLKATGATAKTIAVTQTSILVPNPTDLEAVSGDASATATWTKGTHATSYKAYLCEEETETPATVGTDFSENINISGDDCTLALTGLTNNTTYYLYVKVNGVDENYVATSEYVNVSFTPVATKELVSIALTTAPTKTIYNVGGVFSLAGAVVTATYNDETTTDVTDDCETEYDFSTIGSKTVTISYTEGGVTLTTTCDVTVAYVDVLTYSLLSDGMSGNSGYKAFNEIDGSGSDAVYSGQINYSSTISYIQIRLSSPSGIVSTTSGGLVKKVFVSYAGTNTVDRTLTVYGKNTAYSGPADLYDNNKRGSNIGTITFSQNDNSGYVDISGDYEYVGLLSSGAMYFAEIDILWEPGTPTIAMEKTSISNVAAAGVTNASENGVYTLKFDASDDDVTVTCDGSIVTAASKNNGAITYTVTANTGAARQGWIKVQYGTEDPHEVTVSQNAATYTLTLSSGGNGTVTATVDDAAVASGDAVAVGKTVTVTTTPSSGYQLATLVYNDGSDHDIISTKSFTMPAHTVTVTASFSAVPTISMDKTSITNVSADGVTNASESGVYSFHNGATDADVTVTCDETIVTAASKNNGAITYTVAANTGAARSGWIKVQYGSEDPHTVTVSQLAGADGPSDQSANYTGNISVGNSYKVTIGSTDYNAHKAGTGKAAGSVSLTIPSGTKYLHLHAAAWNNENVTLVVTPDGYSSNIALTADSGIQGSGTTYDVDDTKCTTDYYKVITFTDALEEVTELTFAASGGNRFVIWGVYAE